MAERTTISRNPALDPFLAQAYERGLGAGREGNDYPADFAVKDLTAAARAAGVRTDTIDHAYIEGRRHGYDELHASTKAAAHAAYQAALAEGKSAGEAMLAAQAVTLAARI